MIFDLLGRSGGWLDPPSDEVRTLYKIQHLCDRSFILTCSNTEMDARICPPAPQLSITKISTLSNQTQLGSGLPRNAAASPSPPHPQPARPSVAGARSAGRPPPPPAARTRPARPPTSRRSAPPSATATAGPARRRAPAGPRARAPRRRSRRKNPGRRNSPRRPAVRERRTTACANGSRARS